MDYNLNLTIQWLTGAMVWGNILSASGLIGVPTNEPPLDTSIMDNQI